MGRWKGLTIYCYYYCYGYIKTPGIRKYIKGIFNIQNVKSNDLRLKSKHYLQSK